MKMLEKIQNPGPSEIFLDFPGLSRANIFSPDFAGFPGCVATLFEAAQLRRLSVLFSDLSGVSP